MYFTAILYLPADRLICAPSPRMAARVLSRAKEKAPDGVG